MRGFLAGVPLAGVMVWIELSIYRSRKSSVVTRSRRGKEQDGDNDE